MKPILITGLLILLCFQNPASAFFSPTAGKETYFFHDIYFPSWRIASMASLNSSTHFEFEKALPSRNESLYFSFTAIGTVYYLTSTAAANRLKIYYKSEWRHDLCRVLGTTVTFGQSTSASADIGVVFGRGLLSWIRFYAPFILSVYNDGYIINYGTGLRVGSGWAMDIGIKGESLSTYNGNQKENDLNLVLGAGYVF